MYNIYYNPDENAKGLIENEINKMDGLLEEKIQKKETELKETMRTKKGNITKIVHDPLKTFSNQQRKETNIIKETRISARDFFDIPPQKGEHELKLYKQNIKAISEILKITLERLSFGSMVCDNRLLEGRYINKSLELIRKTISSIISHKNKDIISSYPDLVNDECIEQYKDGAGKDCFTLENEYITKDSVIPSEIFKDIKEFFKGPDPAYGTNDFYDDILVSVFCVLNLDKSANNPPPTPHVDLNEINVALNQYEEVEDIDTLTKATKNLIQKLRYYKHVDDSEGNEIGIEENFFTLEDDQDMKITQYINEKNDRNAEVILKEINNDYISNIAEMLLSEEGPIAKIENSNAVTSIGTLEFIDKISKYQLTKTTCMGDYRWNAEE